MKIYVVVDALLSVPKIVSPPSLESIVWCARSERVSLEISASQSTTLCRCDLRNRYIFFFNFALQTEFHVCCLYNFHFFSFTAGISLKIFGAIQTHRAKEVKKKSQSVDWQYSSLSPTMTRIRCFYRKSKVLSTINER